MSPRCKDKGNTKKSFHGANLVTFSFFTLSLRHENSFYHFRKHLPRTRHSRHLPAATAHHAIPAAYRRPLFQRVATTIQLVAESPPLRPIYPQLPRKQSVAATGKSGFAYADVGNDDLLHLISDSFLMGKDSHGADCCRSLLSYPFFQDIKVMRQSLACISQFIFPVFHRVLSDNIGDVLHGDKRNLL